ncbi:MAG: NAD(P)-dependent oxidoreductase [Cloacibacillus evryensis]
MNLAKGGGVTVFDINESNLAKFSGLKNVKTTGNTDDICEAGVIFLCLPNGDIVKKTTLGKNGLISKMKKGAVLADLSTISWKAAMDVAEGCAETGIEFMDCPISGMEARAIDGTLTVMCGGKEETFRRIEPLLKMIGTNILYMGKNGAGQLTKLINQLLFDINAAAIAEVVPMAALMGLDPEKTASVINSGTGRSYASEFFLPRAPEGNFSEGYAMKNAYKDLVSAAEISASQSIPMPVLAAATATYQQALRSGYGELGKGAMIKVFEKLLGTEFRKG